MIVLAGLLLVLALVFVGFGFEFLTVATQGAGLIALAVFFAVLARIAQASHDHSELMRALARGE